MNADLPPPTVDCALHETHASRVRCETETLLQTEPGNADAWVRLGFLRSSSGDADGARAAFSRALDIAPDYDDAKLGMAQLAYRSGDLDGARGWLRRIAPHRQSDPEVVALSRSVAAAGRGAWRMDAAVSYSTLTQNLDPWREASWSLSRRNSAGWLGAGVDYARRFGSTDVFGEVRFSRALAGGTWGAALGGAPDADFKPEAALRLEFATGEDADWAFDGSATLARYAVGRIDRVGLRAARRLSESIRAIAQTVLVHDETGELRTGYGVGAAWRPGERSEITVSWTDAPESSEGATIDVRSLGLGFAVDIAPDLRLRVGVTSEDRDAYDRLDLSFGLVRTF